MGTLAAVRTNKLSTKLETRRGAVREAHECAKVRTAGKRSGAMGLRHVLVIHPEGRLSLRSGKLEVVFPSGGSHGAEGIVPHREFLVLIACVSLEMVS